MLHHILTHPLLSSIFLATAFCFPQHAWLCLLVFLIPTLSYLEKNSFSIKSGLTTSFFIGCSFIPATAWFLESYPLDWLHITDPILSTIIIGLLWFGFVITLAIPLTLWVMVVCYFSKFPLYLKALIASVAWVSVEHLRSWIIAFFLASPETLIGPHHTYYSLAYPIAHTPLLKELLPIGGLPLGVIWIILCNFFLYSLLSSVTAPKRNTHITITLIFILLPLGSATLMYAIRPSQEERSQVSHIPVTILQTNFPSSRTLQEQDRKSALVIEFLEKIGVKQSVIVMPENIDLTTRSFQQSLASNSYIGSYTGKHGYQMYFLHPAINLIAFTQKQLLMPLGEYSLPWLERLVRMTKNQQWITALTTPHEYLPNKGQGTRLFYSPYNGGIVIGGTLCSENISPLISRQQVFGGASLLMHSASLGPFHGSTLLSRQMLAINTARALENGRYYLSAANRAQSSIISDTGKFSLQEKYTTSKDITAISARVPLLSYFTPFTLLGDILSPFAIILTILALLWKNWLYRHIFTGEKSLTN